MDFQKLYEEKKISVEEAVKLVKDGDWVDLGWSVLTPKDFEKALADRAEELYDVNVRAGVVPFMPAIASADPEAKHITYNSFHTAGGERKMVNSHKSFYIPIKYSEVPRYFRENLDKASVAVITTTPMDKFGNFNFGLSSSHTIAMLEAADKIVVEVNENVPKALGDQTFINVRDVDFVVESSNYAMPALPKGKFGEIEKTVAKFVVNEIVDGSTLQLGIGALPAAIGSLIADSDLKDLGVHSEMYADAFVDLTKAGKINGKRKTRDRFKQTYAFAMGTQEMYDFIDNNEELMAAPVEYVNDVDVIASFDNYMSINSALEIDLYGQISSESSGFRHISGAGGAMDFMIGAHRSKGGKSFITLLSSRVDKDGKRSSNIVPGFKSGTQATGSRANAHYIVTEQGIVNLKGKSTWQRAEALISIAHPELRDELIKEAEKNGIWRKSNK